MRLCWLALLLALVLSAYAEPLLTGESGVTSLLEEVDIAAYEKAEQEGISVPLYTEDNDEEGTILADDEFGGDIESMEAEDWEAGTMHHRRLYTVSHVVPLRLANVAAKGAYDPLRLPKFDRSLGKLTMAKMGFVATARARVGYKNMANVPGVLSYSATGNLTFARKGHVIGTRTCALSNDILVDARNPNNNREQRVQLTTNSTADYIVRKRRFLKKLVGEAGDNYLMTVLRDGNFKIGVSQPNITVTQARLDVAAAFNVDYKYKKIKARECPTDAYTPSVTVIMSPSGRGARYFIKISTKPETEWARMHYRRGSMGYRHAALMRMIKDKHGDNVFIIAGKHKGGIFLLRGDDLRFYFTMGGREDGCRSRIHGFIGHVGRVPSRIRILSPEHRAVITHRDVAKEHHCRRLRLYPRLVESKIRADVDVHMPLEGPKRNYRFAVLAALGPKSTTRKFRVSDANLLLNIKVNKGEMQTFPMSRVFGYRDRAMRFAVSRAACARIMRDMAHRETAELRSSDRYQKMKAVLMERCAMRQGGAFVQRDIDINPKDKIKAVITIETPAGICESRPFSLFAPMFKSIGTGIVRGWQDWARDMRELESEEKIKYGEETKHDFQRHSPAFRRFLEKLRRMEASWRDRYSTVDEHEGLQLDTLNQDQIAQMETAALVESLLEEQREQEEAGISMDQTEDSTEDIVLSEEEYGLEDTETNQDEEGVSLDEDGAEPVAEEVEEGLEDEAYAEDITGIAEAEEEEEDTTGDYETENPLDAPEIDTMVTLNNTRDGVRAYSAELPVEEEGEETNTQQEEDEEEIEPQETEAQEDEEQEEAQPQMQHREAMQQLTRACHAGNIAACHQLEQLPRTMRA